MIMRCGEEFSATKIYDNDYNDNDNDYDNAALKITSKALGPLFPHG